MKAGRSTVSRSSEILRVPGFPVFPVFPSPHLARTRGLRRLSHRRAARRHRRGPAAASGAGRGGAGRRCGTRLLPLPPRRALGSRFSPSQRQGRGPGGGASPAGSAGWLAAHVRAGGEPRRRGRGTRKRAWTWRTEPGGRRSC